MPMKHSQVTPLMTQCWSSFTQADQAAARGTGLLRELENEVAADIDNVASKLHDRSAEFNYGSWTVSASRSDVGLTVTVRVPLEEVRSGQTGLPVDWSFQPYETLTRATRLLHDALVEECAWVHSCRMEVVIEGGS